MTMIQTRKITCANCKKECEQTMVLSSCAFGYSDLDNRPPYPARGNLGSELFTCPHCKYTHFYLDKGYREESKEIVSSKKYQRILRSKMDYLVKKYILSNMILEKAGDNNGLANNLLSIAWLYDDYKKPRRAKKFRKMAIEPFIKVYEETKNMNILFILLDIYRRIGEFGKALELAKTFEAPVDEEKMLPKLKEFQIKLCQEKDDKRHTMGEFLEEK